MHSHRHSLASRHIVPPPLVQFILLSMLLHVLLVLLFGTSNYGGARRGGGLLDSLDVTLRDLSSEQGSGFTIAPGADTQFPGAALLRRLESSPATPVPSVRRDAAPAATPRPPAGSPPPEPARTPAPPAAPVVESTPDVAISARPQPAESLPKLDLSAPTEVDKPIAVPVPAAPVDATPTLAPPANLPPAIAPPAIAPTVITPPVALPYEPPPPPAQPLERIAPARIESQMAPPVDLRPREVPVAPAKVEQEPVTPIDVRPREVPVPASVPLERIVPPQIERQMAPPLEMPAPRRTPVEATAPAHVAPSVERETAPVPQALPRSEAIENVPPRERPSPAVIAPGKAPAPLAPAQANPNGERAKGGELPRLHLGVPNVDDEVFRSRRDGPASSGDAGAALPGINGEAMHRRAREAAIEGSGSRGVLNLVPPPPERKDRLAEDIAKAAKPDCRTAYGGMGLLAVLPLVASSVGSGGCNW